MSPGVSITHIARGPTVRLTTVRGISRGRASLGLTCGLAALVPIVLALSGCSDNRISVHDLHKLEEQIQANAETVQLQPNQIALNEVQTYRIGVGDIMSVSLTGLPGVETTTAGGGAANAPIRARVHEDGTISLPLTGPVKVAGMDLAGAEKAIIDAYVPNIVKSVAVFVELGGTETTTVIVRGAAGLPGLVSLRSNQRNLLYALAQSGGFGQGASGRIRIMPVRPDQQELAYDLTDTNDLRRVLQHPPLQSGDTIVVEPQAVSAVYVLGLVNLQGPIALPVGGRISVVQAVAAAGGLRDWLEPKEATISRVMPSGQRVRVKLHLADMIACKESDFDLKAGDILQVPHTADTRMREWALANLRVGPFGIGAYYDPIQVSTFKDRGDQGRVGVGRVIRDSFLFGATNAVSQRVFLPQTVTPAAAP